MSWGKSLMRAISAVSLGLALALLISAVGLALTSWLTGQPSPALGAWGDFLPPEAASLGAHTPQSIAVALCWLVGLLLATTVIAWFVGRTHPGTWILPAAVGVMVLLFMTFYADRLGQFVGWMMFYPRTAQLPVMLSAWRLGLIGVVALIIGSFAIPRRAHRGWRVPVVVGILVGLVVSASAANLAVRAGDDRRFVDASIASSPSADLPIPATLGTKRFTLKVSDWTNWDQIEHNGWYVEPIAGGFVTYGNGKVTAYGPDSAERWHYSRSGPGESLVTSLHVFDGGQTVVAGIGSYPSILVGLDAPTGRRLWWSSNKSLVDTYRRVIDHRLPPGLTYLVDEDPDALTWTRFDTRTGNRLWTAPAPGSHCPDWGDGFARFLQSAERCPGSDGTDILFAVADPATGTTTWEATVLRGLPYTAEDFKRHRVALYASHAGDGAAILTVGPDDGERRTVFANAARRSYEDLGSPVYPILTTDGSDAALTHDNDRATLRSPDGREQCSFNDRPANATGRISPDGMALILDRQVVFGTRDALATFDRNTCAETESVPTPSRAAALMAAPGVNLVVRTDDTGTWVDGYA
ncbi:PQQ-binding-like beta-propeller repeat protein [Mycobacterium sp. TNTM28]|uniref:PQQ-binding-like beta-propeller repeat protein n=1 Tax=[Mycobacterium] fortunisiensis TaxID=2600579 RepID=A0ABS6KFK9_9MYCO|nr:PQQ-binding-like beta-propeller repeat protein [[Mycobacterium] fortunisiensis]MBU9762348.1 PQQ-binding-like beta-propeller repeat protein [[Mycobacterium] fortunisiensis]